MSKQSGQCRGVVSVFRKDRKKARTIVCCEANYIGQFTTICTSTNNKNTYK